MTKKSRWAQASVDLGLLEESNSEQQQLDYPANVFPEIVRESMLETGQNIKEAPIAMIGSIYLGAMSLAAQGLFDVSPTNGRKSPSSCIILVLAGSGTGKSPIYKVALSPFYKFQNKIRNFAQNSQPEFNNRHELWSLINSGLLKLIRNKAIKGISHAEEDNQLKIHKEGEPKPTKIIQIMYEDASQDSLKAGLNKNGNSICIATPEGGKILTESIFRNLSIFLKLWNGEPFDISRITRDSFSIMDARCTILICAQPEMLGEILIRKWKDFYSSGFLPRSFVVLIERKNDFTCTDIKADSWEHLPAFHDKVTQLLEEQYPGLGQQPTPERRCLTFTPDAETYWLQYENKIKQDTGLGGFFEEFTELAAKMPDNIARVAALFHVFDGKKGPIPLETVERATQLCCWYAEEYVGVFSRREEQQKLCDAELLENWLKKYFSSNNFNKIAKNTIRQYGPNILRDKIKLGLALEQLRDSGKIAIFTEGKTEFIELYSVNYTDYTYGYY